MSPCLSMLPPSEVPTRHSTLWFEDGNIVLVTDAENVGFKVHRSILARQSLVFRDMFEIPQPMHEEEYDGCAMIHVYDTAADLAIFIEVLYDGFK